MDTYKYIISALLFFSSFYTSSTLFDRLADSDSSHLIAPQRPKSKEKLKKLGLGHFFAKILSSFLTLTNDAFLLFEISLKWSIKLPNMACITKNIFSSWRGDLSVMGQKTLLRQNMTKKLLYILNLRIIFLFLQMHQEQQFLQIWSNYLFITQPWPGPLVKRPSPPPKASSRRGARWVYFRSVARATRLTPPPPRSVWGLDLYVLPLPSSWSCLAQSPPLTNVPCIQENKKGGNYNKKISTEMIT